MSETILAPPQDALPVPATAVRSYEVLLLQVRDDQRALHHERLCFLERLGLPPERLRSVNVVTDEVPGLEEALESDLVVLGGAGRHSAHNDYPFTRALAGLVERLVDAGHPFFGSCFGHQFLARVLGSEVRTDVANEEVGTFDLELTPEGRCDPLFAGWPDRFTAHLGHHDQVVDLPPGTLNLASSLRCRHQVLRVADKPVYGSQFHSEMTADHMRERLLMYRDEYMPGADAMAALDSRLRPTELADRLLARFVALYVV